MTKKVYWIHIFIPLILGAMIYALFSPEAYFVTMLRQIFHVPPWSISIRSSFGNMIVGILRNYGCDMLWVYSLIYAVHFYSRHTAIPLWGVFIIGSGMGIMIEILQAFSLIAGTFDIFDVLLEVLSAFIATIGVCSWIRKGNAK